MAAADGAVRLLIHDYAGHPFQVQLSRALAARGQAPRPATCSCLTRHRSAPAGVGAAPRVRAVAIHGTGIDLVPLESATARGAARG